MGKHGTCRTCHKHNELVFGMSCVDCVGPPPKRKDVADIDFEEHPQIVAWDNARSKAVQSGTTFWRIKGPKHPVTIRRIDDEDPVN